MLAPLPYYNYLVVFFGVTAGVLIIFAALSILAALMSFFYQENAGYPARGQLVARVS